MEPKAQKVPKVILMARQKLKAAHDKVKKDKSEILQQ